MLSQLGLPSQTDDHANTRKPMGTDWHNARINHGGREHRDNFDSC